MASPEWAKQLSEEAFQMVKRPKSNIIGEKGENLFPALLPDNFSCNDFKRDYGNDFIIQYFENEETTKYWFFAQVKTEETLKSSKGFIRIGVPTGNLRDYLEKSPCPVFLVGIDKSKGQGYWVFIQEYLQTILTDAKWKKQKKLGIKIPTSQTLNDAPSLIQAVKNAHEYVRKMGLGEFSPKDFMEAQKFFYESMDPRFKVEVTYEKDGMHLECMAKSGCNPELQLRALGEDNLQKIQNLLPVGQPIELSGEGLAISGSPLFDDINVQKICFIPSRTVTRQMKIRVVDSDKKTLESLDVFDVVVAVGNRGATIRGAIGISPIKIDISFWIDNSQISFNQNFFSFERWQGQAIEKLAYFDQIHGLFKSYGSGCAIELKLSENGNEIDPEMKLSFSEKHLEGINEILDIYYKARFLAKHFGVSPIAPADISCSDVENIETLYQLIAEGSIACAIPNFKFKAKLPREEAIKILNTHINQVGLSFTGFGDEIFRFFDTEIPVSQLRFDVSNCSFENPDVLRDEVSEQADTDVSIGIIGTPSSIMTKRWNSEVRYAIQ